MEIIFLILIFNFLLRVSWAIGPYKLNKVNGIVFYKGTTSFFCSLALVNFFGKLYYKFYKFNFNFLFIIIYLTNTINYYAFIVKRCFQSVIQIKNFLKSNRLNNVIILNKTVSKNYLYSLSMLLLPYNNVTESVWKLDHLHPFFKKSDLPFHINFSSFELQYLSATMAIVGLIITCCYIIVKAFFYYGSEEMPKIFGRVGLKTSFDFMVLNYTILLFFIFSQLQIIVYLQISIFLYYLNIHCLIYTFVIVFIALVLWYNLLLFLGAFILTNRAGLSIQDGLLWDYRIATMYIYSSYVSKWSDFLSVKGSGFLFPLLILLRLTAFLFRAEFNTLGKNWWYDGFSSFQSYICKYRPRDINIFIYTIFSILLLVYIILFICSLFYCGHNPHFVTNLGNQWKFSSNGFMMTMYRRITFSSDSLHPNDALRNHPFLFFHSIGDLQLNCGAILTHSPRFNNIFISKVDLSGFHSTQFLYPKSISAECVNWPRTDLSIISLQSTEPKMRQFVLDHHLLIFNELHTNTNTPES